LLVNEALDTKKVAFQPVGKETRTGQSYERPRGDFYYQSILKWDIETMLGGQSSM
jgi:hypothetical protein